MGCHNEYPIWSTDPDKQRDLTDRVKSFEIIKEIVTEYGGTMDVDFRAGRMSITVPEKDEAECSLRIEEAMEGLNKVGVETVTVQ